MDSEAFTLPVRAPFSFARVLHYLEGSPARVVERVDDGCYRRPLRVDGRPLLVTVMGSDQPGAELSVTLTGRELSQAAVPSARRTLARTFGTDIDLAPLQVIANRGDALDRELVERFEGMRPVLLPDLFETITWAIIGQQINVIFAAKCKRAFVERYGERVEIGGEKWLLYPTAERVAAIPESELSEIQFSRQKSRYVVNLARAIVEGDFDVPLLYELPVEDALAALESLTGIGRWTAEYVLMRGVGQRDVIPAADGGLRRIIGQRYGLGRLASEQEVRVHAERWTGWRSYFAFYLWFTLQEEERTRREARARISGRSKA